jgi:ADP-ribose pyrophosphatase YjhB (NUDIX family)
MTGMRVLLAPRHTPTPHATPDPIKETPMPGIPGTSVCDHKSVGVIVTHAVTGRYLLFARATPPVGIAPPAGHVDDHGGWEDAARTEVTEEVGLVVDDLRLVADGWRDNRCRRPSSAPHGHDWHVYAATVTDTTLNPSPRETRGAAWRTKGEVIDLVERTAAHARGELDEDEFTARPGIEPVWAQWLVDAGVVSLSRHELRLIDAFALQDPTRGSGPRSRWNAPWNTSRRSR